MNSSVDSEHDRKRQDDPRTQIFIKILNCPKRRDYYSSGTKFVVKFAFYLQFTW